MTYEIKLKVKDLIDEKGMIGQIISVGENTSRVLLLTDVTHSISDIVRGTRTVINFEHLSKIAEALKVNDIRELIDFK